MTDEIKRYTVAELRDAIDELLATGQLLPSAPVIIDDYEGNCATNGVAHFRLSGEDNALYISCDFGGDCGD